MLTDSSNPIFNSIFKIFVDRGEEVTGGVPIVLTSSRAEMSHYNNNPFVAFVCTFPHRLIPRRYKARWLKPVDNPDGTEKFAPYGLRKVEAILADTFGRANVVVYN
jgi:hypothetical protein